MKLRNKKTGEIIIPSDYTFATYDDGIRYGRHTYYSLAELNAEWEDVEEPDEVWYIDWKGDVRSADIDNDWECEKAIGNYFETKEEAEKAVEKLKAWKRLKDKGFKFKTWGWEDKSDNEYTIYFTLDSKSGDAADLDLLFGGEE